jgi:hypothetical protein
MIRSGSTLQYNLVRLVIEKSHLGYGKGYLRPAELPDQIEQLVSWAQDPVFTFVVKSHQTIPELLPLLENGKVKIFYIFRDIRDVAVSARHKFEWHQEDKGFHFLNDAISTFYEVKSLPNVVCQRYEDLIIDLHSGVRFIAQNLGIPVSDDLISAIAIECSLENAQKSLNDLQRFQHLRDLSRLLLRQSGLIDTAKRILEHSPIPERYWRGYDSERTLLQDKHISKNKGLIGQWKTELTKEQSLLIFNRYAQWFQDAGYDF